jgi:hypothetical protein
MFDIRPKTPILILSMGEIREFHLRDTGTKEVKYRLPMLPGSLFVLGPVTNATMEHAIVVQKEETLINRKSKVQSRLSLVLRDIKTVITLDQVKKKTETKKRADAKKETKMEKRKMGNEEETPKKKKSKTSK